VQFEGVKEQSEQGYEQAVQIKEWFSNWKLPMQDELDAATEPGGQVDQHFSLNRKGSLPLLQLRQFEGSSEQVSQLFEQSWINIWMSFI